ncbi:Uncharacterized protein Rs2_29708 [Raphanus sativus]|nr:Uncharacterized protein Rs2_29708 [Raphanus sativus]
MIARASAMRGEATVGPEKFQASPTALRFLFQAASVLHVMILVIEEAFVALGCRSRFTSGVDLMFSKTSLFRAIQIDLSIQGKMAPTTPVGGRQTVPLNFMRASVNSVSAFI